MIKEINTSIDKLATWRDLAEHIGISVAYCKAKLRGQYLPIVRKPGWGSPAVIMHVSLIPEIASAFNTDADYVEVHAYWWGVRFERTSVTSAQVCELWRIGTPIPFKVETRITWGL